MTRKYNWSGRENPLIRNERELAAAQKWMEYWKSTRLVGQSWLANEQAFRKIAELRREIDDYRRRSGLPAPIVPQEVAEQPV
jgi:hypothetical protein